QLLRRAGMGAYVFMRPGPHEKALPGPLFRWRSPDGSEVLAYRLPHEYCSPREDLGNHLDKSIAQLPAAWAEMMCFYGVGNHGGGPTRENLDSIRRLSGVGTMPRLEHSTPERFFEAIRADGHDGLPVVEDDLQHHAVGCYSAHSGIKRWNRRAENALGTAEAWSAVAAIAADQPYPTADFERAWRQVLFNQFHDVLAGTAIEPAYEEARDQLGEATSIAARARNHALQSIASRIDLPFAAGSSPIVVFNPHPWPVRTAIELEFGGLKPTDGVTDDGGRPIAMQPTQSYATVSSWRSRMALDVELPPLGYRAYRVTADATRPTTSTVRATASGLENEHVRLTIDPATGRLARLALLGPDGAEVADLADPTRLHAVVVDDTSDTWGHRRLGYRDEIGAFEVSNVEPIETGPVRAILRVESRYGDSTLVEDHVLAAGDRAIEVRVVLDWRERGRLLKLRYPTRLNAASATYEIPYGVIERPANGDEEPGQRWVDVSGTLRPGGSTVGLAVLNDGKYAFDVAQGSIGVTAVRSPIFAHHEPAVPRPGVRYAYQDIGLQRFHLALVPHVGSWDDAGLSRRAALLNQPPDVLLESFHPGPFPAAASHLAVEPANVVVGAIKLAEDGGDLVIRLVETAGRPTAARVSIPMLDRALDVDVGPFEIRTFRVPRDPSAPVVETDLLERPADD
ncbi:MAG TPA: glycoside hydrolase family 38 C-terminal domain-containing protein, partial [Candidatus Limnocylindrales bacterium]